MNFNESCDYSYIESTSKILKTCTNEPVDLKAISSGVIADIPVVLAITIVKLHVNHLIKLPEVASNIKTIKNKVLITACKISHDTNMIFLKGVIVKKIYYSAYENSKYYKIDIPFEYTKNIILDNSTKCKLIHNTHPFCELMSIKITEQCNYKYSNNKSYNSNIIDHNEIIELDSDLIINLEIQILQNQQVLIKPQCSHNEDYVPDNYEEALNNKTNLVNTLKPHDKTNITDNAHLMHTDYVNDLLESDNSNDLSKLLKLYILIYHINSDNYNKYNYNNYYNSYKCKANIIKFLLLLICALIHNDSRVY